MIPKILVYLENGPIQFGISKYVKENLSCELFGVINTNKGKEFYKTQELVKFKQYWFIRDYLMNNNNTKPDIEYLKYFEKKYKIDLWKAIFSDAIFLEHNKFHKFSKDEILTNVQELCKMYEKILEEHKPDFLIIRITDAIADHLLYLICKAKNIKVLILNFTRLGYRNFISSEVDSLDEDAFSNYEEKKLSQEEVLQLVKGFNKQQKSLRKNYRNSFIEWLKASFYFFQVISSTNYQKYYAHKGRSISKIILNELKFKIRLKKHQKFLRKNAIVNLDMNKKYVYFPLGSDPERSTLIPTPYYANQLETIKNISRSLPIDYQLYVKEHPVQIIWAWRDLHFYKQILELPNVKLIHPSVDNEKLLKNTSLVMTLVGTTAMEAAVYKIPSIVFGDVLFSSLPSVFKVENIKELPILIKNAINTKVDFDDVNKFMNIITSNSFEYDDQELINNINYDLFYRGYIFDIDIKNEKMKRCLEKNKNVFELLGKEHLIKIEKHLNTL
tara:strand:+ start:141 stop:1640 length:1500 start_codon:yes stop_codon:yes gene_type:complete